MSAFNYLPPPIDIDRRTEAYLLEACMLEYDIAYAERMARTARWHRDLYARDVPKLKARLVEVCSMLGI